MPLCLSNSGVEIEITLLFGIDDLLVCRHVRRNRKHDLTKTIGCSCRRQSKRNVVNLLGRLGLFVTHSSATSRECSVFSPGRG